MVNRKSVRTRGKISFSRYFAKFNEGDSVAYVEEKSINSNIPKRLQGRTGKIFGMKGKSYIVKMKDQTKEKTYLIEPVHLRKIQW